MKGRTILFTGALAIPALLLPLASCNDSSRSPAEPSVPTAPAFKTAPTTKLTAGPRINVAGRVGGLASAAAATTTTTSSIAPHDPTRTGVLLKCFNGAEVGPPFGFYGGTSKKFSNNRGCEINTMDGNPNGSVAGAFPASRSYLGRRLKDISHLDFYYAGGPQLGGAPRLNIPIDECENVQPTKPVATTTTSTSGCAPGFATDGFYDGTAFTDNSTCNDGDPYVGAVKAEDYTACNINYKGVDYPNWDTFAAAFPGARIARKYDAVTSGTGKIEPADILILADQPVHYLVYRVDIR